MRRKRIKGFTLLEACRALCGKNHCKADEHGDGMVLAVKLFTDLWPLDDNLIAYERYRVEFMGIESGVFTPGIFDLDFDCNSFDYQVFQRLDDDLNFRVVNQIVLENVIDNIMFAARILNENKSKIDVTGQ